MADATSHAAPGIRPAFAGDACLRSLGVLADCRLCEAECPVAAIVPADRDISLGDACIGCGRCTAICPTGALHGPHNDIEALTQRTSRMVPLHAECERVPAALHAPNTVVTPCLGALGANELLALQERCGASPLTLVDRQWCSSCPAGGDAAPPGAAGRSQVTSLFMEMGFSHRAPVVVIRPPGGRKRDDDATRKRSRRAFLRRLSPAVAASAPKPDRGSRRRDLVAVLRRIGGRSLPSSAFPVVRISDACADHRLCASICPTGALEAYVDDRIGIAFAPDRCIACGACAAICPEQAVSLSQPDDGAPSGPVRLTARTSRICGRCDADFSSADEAQELCPNCRKDTGLFQREN